MKSFSLIGLDEAKKEETASINSYSCFELPKSKIGRSIGDRRTSVLNLPQLRKCETNTAELEVCADN